MGMHRHNHNGLVLSSKNKIVQGSIDFRSSLVEPDPPFATLRGGSGYYKPSFRSRTTGSW